MSTTRPRFASALAAARPPLHRVLFFRQVGAFPARLFAAACPAGKSAGSRGSPRRSASRFSRLRRGESVPEHRAGTRLASDTFAAAIVGSGVLPCSVGPGAGEVGCTVDQPDFWEPFDFPPHLSDLADFRYPPPASSNSDSSTQQQEWCADDISLDDAVELSYDRKDAPRAAGGKAPALCCFCGRPPPPPARAIKRRCRRPPPLCSEMRATPIAAALAVLVLWLPAAPARQYAVSDDAAASQDDDAPSPARPDYSRYFASAAAPGLAVLAPADPQQKDAAADSAGFVRPLDFSALFAAASDAAPGSAALLQLQPQGLGLASPGAHIFGLQDATGAASNSNGTAGFTSDQVRFPSLFDAAGSASEAGFRPQDFLASAAAPGGGAQPLAAASPSQDAYSPSLTKLQRDYSLRPTHYDAAIRAAATGLRAAAVELLPGAPVALAQTRPRPYVGYRAAPEVEGIVAAAPSGNYYRPAQATKREQPQYYSGSSYDAARAPGGDPADYEGLASFKASIVPYQKPSKAEAEASEPRPGKSSYPGTPTAGYNGKYLKPEKADAGRYHDDGYETAAAAADKAVGGYKGSNYKEAAYEEVAAVAKEGKAAAGGGSGEGGKKCKRVEKKVTADDVASGRFRRQAMTCFVCEDPATGGNYEECSYGAEPKQEAYFVGSSRSFKAKPTETSLRYRRDLDPELAAMETEARVYRQAPSDYERELDAFLKSDTSSGYAFRPSSSGYGPSERLSAAADNANCQKVVKDSMTCQVCKDPKTGGSSEQCSYSTKPEANNYFVEKQSSYSSGSKQPTRSTSSSYDSRGGASERRDTKLPGKDLTQAASADQPSSGLNLPEVKGLDPFLYGQAESYDPQASSDTSSRYQTDYYAPYKSYEEYFRHLFPDLGAAGSAAQPSASQASGDYSKSGSRPEFYSAPSAGAAVAAVADRKDLDAVLGEFTRKDRSACKKVQRDKMTCYQCADATGTQHEECMFVAASEPKSKHLAYHEHKQFKLPPPPGVPVAAAGKDSTGAASAVDQQTDSGRSNDTTTASPTSETPTTSTEAAAAAKSKRKTFFKKASSSSVVAKPTVAAEPTKARKVRITRRSSKSTLTTLTTTRQTLTAPSALADDAVAAGSERREAIAEAGEASAEPPPPELSEADRSPDGLYSSETRLVFDPVLKVTLPRYMLTRTEHEDVFDEVMASGR
ncbi:uncharacterized protein LOC126259396 [Schistocerca nitens]|uniref:uncharacterized protein LOC126259396 n=1 Tax=Schistocerca nitens TaxID=7011 RepID=UPI0021174800|nr:uncharacterized protein LOC126259396 [Schistocerca nitens]